jgi:membrane-bound lytic murein transglycosylase D
MHLPRHLDKKRVQQEIAWLTRHPGYIKRLESRLQTYLPYLYTQTQLRGMPAELALLPVVESALDTFAFSHGGAAGPWQFISGTARQYGLPINTWYDGRRDIVASTDAALDYLSDLHSRFGDWYLALAGYNAGQGNVSKALRRKPGAHFFDLKLPRETRAYVPRLLALAEVVANPEKYNLELPMVVPGETFATLNTHSQFQMDKLAGVLGLDLEALYKWNPAMNQWATPPDGPHRIIVPVELDLASAQANIDAVPATARVDWTKVKIRQGDTLSTIARRHGTDVASLRTANNLSSNNIRAGRELLIPMNAQALASGPQSFTRGRGQATYEVQAGDSLWSVAKSHKVSLASLMRANHVGPKDTLNVGRQLSIPGTASAQKVIRKVRYKVRRGDSLARIAYKFKVTVSQIVNWNNLDRSKYLQPGQGLLVYVNVTGR